MRSFSKRQDNHIPPTLPFLEIVKYFTTIPNKQKTTSPLINTIIEHKESETSKEKGEEHTNIISLEGKKDEYNTKELGKTRGVTK